MKKITSLMTISLLYAMSTTASIVERWTFEEANPETGINGTTISTWSNAAPNSMLPEGILNFVPNSEGPVTALFSAGSIDSSDIGQLVLEIEMTDFLIAYGTNASGGGSNDRIRFSLITDAGPLALELNPFKNGDLSVDLEQGLGDTDDLDVTVLDNSVHDGNLSDSYAPSPLVMTCEWSFLNNTMSFSASGSALKNSWSGTAIAPAANLANVTTITEFEIEFLDNSLTAVESVADDTFLNLESVTIETQARKTGWAGYPVEEDGVSVDTAGFLGWIDIARAPWIWNYNLNSWVFLDEGFVTQSGGWAYFPRTSPIILKEGFESGLQVFKGSGNTPEVVQTLDARSGSYVMKSQLTPSSTDPKRTEVTLNKEGLIFEVGKEYWVGISIKLGEDFNDSLNFNDQGMLIQWHYFGWLHPEVQDAQPFLLRFQDDAVHVQSELLPDYLAILPPAFGEWVDWVFHLKFDDADGVFQVWRDGESVVDWTGDNHITEMVEGAYLKFGLYSAQYANDPIPNSTTRTVYHDELRIADDQGSYEAVAPRNP